MKLTEEQGRRLIESLRKRFDDGLPQGSIKANGLYANGKRVYGKLHDQIAWRRAHFFNLPEADPVLPDPYGDSLAFQSDAPRQKWEALKARICENEATIRVEADDTTIVKRDSAQVLESYLNEVFDKAQNALEQSLQEYMADAQIIDGVCGVHWTYDPKAVPSWPDYEYRDELKDTDDDPPARYEKNPEYTEGSADPKHKSRFREKAKSLNERRAKMLADHCPYTITVVPGRNMYWTRDPRKPNGIGRMMTIRQLSYNDFSEDAKDRELKVVLKDGKLRREIVGEDTPTVEEPSYEGWEDTVSLVTIWTDTCWYEYAALDHGGSDHWEFIQEGTHNWTMDGVPIVPFAICTAIQVADPDPTLSYQPALAGMYRLKALVDEQTTLMHVMARNIAMPWFYLEKKSGTDAGAPLTDETGKVVAFTADAALGMKIPDGYELKWVNTALNAAFPQSIALMREDWQATFPATGTTDTSASSQPWTVRLKQQEANVTPRALINRQLQPLDICAESIARHCAERALDEPDDSLYHWYERDGKRTLAQISAKDFQTFKVHVQIDATSAAEKVTEMQLGMELLKLGLITEYQFWDEFAGDPDPQKRIDEVVSERSYKQYWEPGIIRQEIARIQGTDTIKNVVVGTNGEIIGPNGQEMAPGEVAGVNGFTNTAPQVAAPVVGGMTVEQPGMGPLNAPGATPVGVSV